MPEIGLLPLARVALDVAAAILPPYRSRFSKRQFTRPQLLAVLCLMRYEDWTFRETEVRLREHRELRETLKLSSVPDHTTLYRFLQRLDDPTIDRVLGEAARRFKSPKRRARRRARVAVDGTGLSHNAASTFFIRRIEQRPRGMTRWSYWLKWLIVTDLDKRIILAQRGQQAPWCDCRSLPDWWMRPEEFRRSAWCWPTLNSTLNKTIDTFANGWERTASSPPSVGAAVAWASAGRCGDIFRKRPIGNGPKWKRSSPSSNANSPPVPRDAACRCKSARPPCSD